MSRTLKEEPLFWEKPEGTEILYGYHPVTMAMEAGKRQVHRVFYNQESNKVLPVVEDAKQRGIPTKAMSPIPLNSLCQKHSTRDVQHNGILAHVSRLTPVVIEHPIDPLPNYESDSNLWILLASISDVRNLGAILRTAYYMGVRGCPTFTHLL